MSAPVKVGGKWILPGHPAEVSAAAAAALDQEGLIAPEPDTEAGEAEPTAEERLIAAKAEAIARAVVDQAVSVALEELTAARDAAEEGVAHLSARVEALTGELEDERADHAETRAALVAAQARLAEATRPDIPPAEAAAKTAQKKGAAVPKG